VPGLERGKCRLGVDQCAPARIDQHGAGLHGRDRFLVHQMMGVLVQRAVQGDDVADTKGGVEIHVGHPEVDEWLIDDRVEGHHLAAEMPQQPCNDRSDLPRADHRRRLARHVETHQSLEREVPLAHTVVGPMDLAIQRQHERQGVFGHGVR
jgi:hypothetical protein